MQRVAKRNVRKEQRVKFGFYPVLQFLFARLKSSLPFDRSRAKRFSFPPGAVHFLLTRQKKMGGRRILPALPASSQSYVIYKNIKEALL